MLKRHTPLPIKKPRLWLLVAAALFIAASNAHAAWFRYEGISVVPDSQLFSSYFVPGTILTSTIYFEISVGPPEHAVFQNAQGAVTWNDGESRAFVVNGAGGETLGSNGFFLKIFEGNGPVIESQELVSFDIVCFLNADLLSTSVELSELLPSGNFIGNRAAISTNSLGGAYGDLIFVSGLVSSVPKPVPLHPSLGYFLLALTILLPATQLPPNQLLERTPPCCALRRRSTAR